MHMLMLIAIQQDKTATTPHQPNSTHLSGVGVISAGPSSGTAILVVAVNNTNDGPIRSTNEQESTAHNNEDGPCDHSLPLPAAILAVPVVVQPHTSHGLEAHKGTQERTDKRDEATKDRNSRRDDVRGEGNAAGEAEPGDPMLGGVVVEVVGAAEGTDEEVLCSDLASVSILLL